MLLRSLEQAKIADEVEAVMKKVLFEADKLKDWFQKNARDLPWRNNPTPYAVWISEIMLQQTQVTVVKDYFVRWMDRFPSVSDLAEAPLEEVIKMWEGLGYYSRARNIHTAAQFIVEKHHGVLPSSKELLAEMKGIGPYTIGAILSFAFHKKAAAVDGNVIRVLSRYYGISEDVQKAATLKKIWTLAEEILPNSQPWLVVEGLIELGAMVCKKEANCWACPLLTGCVSYKQGTQAELPKKSKKVEITPLSREVFVISHEGSFLLKKESEGKIMAGLYEFPYKERRKEAAFPFPFMAKKIRNLAEVNHSFTRFKVRLFPAIWEAEEKVDLPDYIWVRKDQIHQFPFSSGHRKILKNLRLDDATIAY